MKKYIPFKNFILASFYLQFILPYKNDYPSLQRGLIYEFDMMEKRHTNSVLFWCFGTIFILAMFTFSFLYLFA